MNIQHNSESGRECDKESDGQTPWIRKLHTNTFYFYAIYVGDEDKPVEHKKKIRGAKKNMNRL